MDTKTIRRWTLLAVVLAAVLITVDPASACTEFLGTKVCGL